MTDEPDAADEYEPSSPLGHALVLIGDMWTVRIVRSIFLGTRRFQDLRDELDISDPVLARRLRSLIEDGVLETRRYSDSPPRSEYLLTDAGIDLRVEHRSPKRTATLHPSVAERFALDSVPHQGGDGPYRPEALRHHERFDHLYL